MWDTFIHRWLKLPYTLNVYSDRGSKKPQATVLLIHGIGNTGAAWDEVEKLLPDTIRVVSIDLLGFGDSPHPAWAMYNVKTQARSLMATFLKLRIRGPIAVVGHSLGALVAVEMAKRYPLIVRSLVLFSPPFYQVDETMRILPNIDKMLRDLYRLAKRHPEQIIKISALALKLGFLNKSFSLTEENAAIYMNALEASIINQTSLDDAVKLKVPMRIVYGKLDPVIVPRNLRYLARHNPSVALSSVLASHEVKGRFVRIAATEITKAATSRN